MMRLPEYAARAIAQLEQAGCETWAVGGCVRDSLRGAEPHDFDPRKCCAFSRGKGSLRPVSVTEP